MFGPALSRINSVIISARTVLPLKRNSFKKFSFARDLGVATSTQNYERKTLLGRCFLNKLLSGESYRGRSSRGPKLQLFGLFTARSHWNSSIVEARSNRDSREGTVFCSAREAQNFGSFDYQEITGRINDVSQWLKIRYCVTCPRKLLPRISQSCSPHVSGKSAVVARVRLPPWSCGLPPNQSGKHLKSDTRKLPDGKKIPWRIHSCSFYWATWQERWRTFFIFFGHLSPFDFLEKISKIIRTGDFSPKSFSGGPGTGTRISLPWQ